MIIRDLIVDAAVRLELESDKSEGAIAELVEALAAAERLKDREKCLADVMHRERQRTTAIGEAVAIPHACTEGVRQPMLAIGRRTAGINFDAPDEAPVQLVFLLLGPQGALALHLRILARLAQILHSAGAIETLLGAPSTAEVLAFFQKRGEELGEVEAPADLPRVCVAGAGAGGLAMAAHLALLGCAPRLYNRSPARIEPVRQTGGILASGAVSGFAKVPVATTDPAEAAGDADLVMVVVPATGHREMAARLGPHLHDGQVVLLNPGRTGGALEFAAVLREKKCTARPVVAEAETLLYACRDMNPGSVHLFGVKNAVPVAALPAYLTPDVLAVTGRVLPYFVAGDNVLKTSLDNIGSIFHPALTILNAAWIEERHGDFEYYREGASPSVALILEALDKERVAVASALGVGAISARDWLYRAYGASGQDLYEAIQANPGYEGIKAPNRLNHRYITEDVPMSLVPIAALGEHLGVPVPSLNAIIHLASVLHRRDYRAEGRTLDKLGLAGLSVQQILRLVVEGVDG
jgi:opine dehydrogenase